MNYNVIILGMNKAGIRLAKEMARFIAYSKEKYKLFLIDRERVNYQENEFMDFEMGFSTAAVTAHDLRVVFPNIKVIAYRGTVEDCVPRAFKEGYIYNETNMYLLLDTMGTEEARTWCLHYIQNKKNCLYLGINHDKIVSELILEEYKVCEADKFDRPYADPVMSAGLLFGQAAMFLQEKKIPKELFYSEKNSFHQQLSEQYNRIRISNNRPWTVCVVGCGGTGGAFIKEFGRFLLGNRDTRMILIDGDRVEARNGERQPFSRKDISLFKAEVLEEGLKRMGVEQKQLLSIPMYLDTAEQLSAILFTQEGRNVALLGCVDNHRARQVMHQTFYSSMDMVYLDSGNEFLHGEVVSAIRINGETLSHARGYYYPEVLVDKGLSASEMSCMEFSEHAPQHLATNLSAGHILYKGVTDCIEKGMIDGGITYFDISKGLRRFQAAFVPVFRQEGGIVYA